MMLRLLRLAIVAVLLIGSIPAAAQQAPETKRFVALFVGQQILRACEAEPSPASQTRLDAELDRRKRGQIEISHAEIAVMTDRMQRNLAQPENHANVCRQLQSTGTEAYIAMILVQ